MPQQGIDPESEDHALLCRMADEALLYLMKMRASRAREGLDVTSLLTFVPEEFPVTRGYMQNLELEEPNERSP